MKTDYPTYKKIALDIANRIIAGHFHEGQYIYGRSSLAGMYNVSPETIRRAIVLLMDAGVVKSMPGKGILITSVQVATEFANKYESVGNISRLKTSLHELTAQRKELDTQILDTINMLIDYTGRLSNYSQLQPQEIAVPSSCRYIGKTIAEIQFWQNTSATLVGVKRNGQLIVSPGPYLVLMKGDIILFIGSEHSYGSVKEFLENGGVIKG